MPWSDDDIKYMREALALAEKGKGNVEPNPMVGAVIVKNGNIIGRGYHKKFGGPHAEIEAINSVQDKDDIKGATMYVTLEPCSHYGKTPPCCEALVRVRIKRVVVGMIDPNPLVKGKGIKYLEKHGVEVIILGDNPR